MQLGMVGLGRMGSNMVKRLLNNGHTSVVYDRSAKAVQDLEKQERRRSLLARRHGQQAFQAARHLADDPRRRGGRNHCRACAPSGVRRHSDRWRQFLLHR